MRKRIVQIEGKYQPQIELEKEYGFFKKRIEKEWHCFNCYGSELLWFNTFEEALMRFTPPKKVEPIYHYID